MMSMLQNGDCLDEMRDLKDCCVDAIVTDPPYGLNFMGQDFDKPKMMGQAVVMHGGLQRYPKGEKRTGYADCDMLMFQDYMTPIFAEALRVAKPGAHILAFGGTRTYHRLTCAIEDAGWEIRDCIMWVYGSGFPKSMDVAKAIDKMHDNEDKEVSVRAASAAAQPWQGWGTCLKPAVEPIVVARKPLEGTVAANCLKYGTGALNIDACRVPYASYKDKKSTHMDRPSTSKIGAFAGKSQNGNDRTTFMPKPPLGRFPANLIHDGSEEVLALFPDSKGQCGAVKGNEPSELTRGIYGKFSGDRPPCSPRNDSGSAARFFYCAKASRKERDCSDHPTMKPLALMRYLVRLVTRKGGIVLDPFMGSGTTGVAAIQEGMNFVGIERDTHYYEIAAERIRKAKPIEQKPKDTQMELPL